MIPQFANLELLTLIDMLAAFTTDYYRMETQGESREKLKAYREMIDELQLEIESRKKIHSTTITGTGVDLKTDQL